ncbi:MAG: hypothetical protein ACRDR6_23980 [Pseudonocardiaceae bacterium]
MSVEARVEWLALNWSGEGVLVMRDGGYFSAGCTGKVRYAVLSGGQLTTGAGGGGW